MMVTDQESLMELIVLKVLSVCNWTCTADGDKSAWVGEKGGARNPFAPVTPAAPLAHAGERVLRCLCIAGHWQCFECCFIWAGFGIEGFLQVVGTKRYMSMTIQPLLHPHIVLPQTCPFNTSHHHDCTGLQHFTSMESSSLTTRGALDLSFPTQTRSSQDFRFLPPDITCLPFQPCFHRTGFQLFPCQNDRFPCSFYLHVSHLTKLH